MGYVENVPPITLGIDSTGSSVTGNFRDWVIGFVWTMATHEPCRLIGEF